MTFLPIVQRKLNVAARRPLTRRVRFWTSGLAIIITLFLLLLIEFSSARSAVGASLFGLVRWYAFGLCLLSGIFLTADSISSERHQGTLGLLFLSELKATREIVHGHAKALALAFFWPIMLFVALLFVPTGFQAARALNDGGLERAFSVIPGSFLAVLTVVRLAVDILALGWFGMALALTSRRPALAAQEQCFWF